VRALHSLRLGLLSLPLAKSCSVPPTGKSNPLIVIGVWSCVSHCVTPLLYVIAQLALGTLAIEPFGSACPWFHLLEMRLFHSDPCEQLHATRAHGHNRPTTPPPPHHHHHTVLTCLHRCILWRAPLRHV
jgi:hypothetical protein